MPKNCKLGITVDLVRAADIHTHVGDVKRHAFTDSLRRFDETAANAWYSFSLGPTSDLDFGSISFCACALSASTFEPTNFDLQCSHLLNKDCQRKAEIKWEWALVCIVQQVRCYKKIKFKFTKYLKWSIQAAMRNFGAWFISNSTC